MQFIALDRIGLQYIQRGLVAPDANARGAVAHAHADGGVAFPQAGEDAFANVFHRRAIEERTSPVELPRESHSDR